ncbi:hypothetical protein QQZ08_010085 [Neonectria magnoliae]|uniref:Uncharacterized protein n=1 Tax=Neonectria magnoliae TaxID=2732573 RepID=A0ABR1HIY9_9HYPO
MGLGRESALAFSRHKPSEVRVVILSSLAHKFTVSSGIDFDTAKNKAERLSTHDRYGQSKLANAITTASVSPGAVKTDLNKSRGGGILFRLAQALFIPIIGVSPQEGARNQLGAATAKEAVSGEYHTPASFVGNESAFAKSDEFGRKLWDWTEKEFEGQSL